MIINLDNYLNELIRKRNNGLIKIITGIRRCGKSFLLFELFHSYLLAQGISEQNIITLSLEDDASARYRNPLELGEYIGSLTNPTKLSNTFKSVKGTTINPTTISNYLDYLIKAFILDNAYRYDIKGKKYINTPLKYYFTDVGLRNAHLNFRQLEENHIMENIIFTELKVRGYSVDVGMLEHRQINGTRKYLEVDFIASLGYRKYYIQSALNIGESEKRNQEIQPLMNIPDSFKKLIVVREHIMPFTDENGIAYIGIEDFLLDENSLDK